MTNLEFEEVIKVISKQNPTLLQPSKVASAMSCYYIGSIEISCNKSPIKTQLVEINGKIPLEVAKTIYEKYSNPRYGIKISQTAYPLNFNPNPVDYAVDEVYEKEIHHYQMQGPEVLAKNKKRALERLHQRPEKNKYIKRYLISTKEGLIAVITELEKYLAKEERKRHLFANKIISLTDVLAEKSKEDLETSDRKRKEISEAVLKNILEKTHPELSTQDWLNELQENQTIFSELLEIEDSNKEYQKLKEALDNFDKAINPYMNEEIQLKEIKEYQENIVIEADYDSSNKKISIKISNPKEKAAEFYSRVVQTVKSLEGISYTIEYDYGDGSALLMKHEYSIRQGEVLTINRYLYNCITQRTVYNITNGTIKTLGNEEIKVDANMQETITTDVLTATSLATSITTNNMAKKSNRKKLCKKK